MNQHRSQGASCAGTPFKPAPPFAANESLHASAEAHSVDMATHNYFSHNSLDGGTPRQRITAAGFTGSAWGEDIAVGYTTPQAVMDTWMGDYPHCANIMSSQLTQVGVGFAQSAASTYHEYWTADFGGP